MQSSQEINWLVILLPSVVVGTIVILGQIVSTYWLNRRNEDYKKEISKELENHKFQLQSDFQTKFYEFQTRYSLIHQKKAEAIEKLFELLAKVQIDIQTWVSWEGISRLETKEEFLLKTRVDFQNLTNYFDEKRIYFDEDIKKEVLKFVWTAAGIIPRYDQFNIAEFVREINKNGIQEGIYQTMEKLEEKFKKLLSAENPNYQIKKNNDQ